MHMIDVDLMSSANAHSGKSNILEYPSIVST